MMRGTVQVVATPEVAVGFTLAGLPTVEVETVDLGADALLEIVRREDVAIVLAEESILQALPERARSELWRRTSPIVVPFPRPTWRGVEVEAAAYIAEILQRAIGYRVRLQ